MPQAPGDVGEVAKRRTLDDSLEREWPRDPLKAAWVGLQLAAYFRSENRPDDAHGHQLYAEHQMRERLGYGIDLAPGQPLLTRREAQHWVSAWNLAATRNFALRALRERGCGPANTHVRKVKRDIAGLRRKLRSGSCGTTAGLRVSPRARGAGRPRARRATTRSSAKSGDSGPAGSSEGDGAGEPPPPRRPEVPLALVPRRALRDWWRRRSRELERASQVRAVVA